LPNFLTSNFKINWNDVWRKNWARKDVVFLLALFHKVIVVNAWRARLCKYVNATCSMCDGEAPETLMHKFYECPEGTSGMGVSNYSTLLT
jgi:hypothetical protein